jgi:hypothetical protein
MHNPLFLALTAELTRFFDGFDGNQRFVLAIIGLGCLTGVLISIAGVVGGCWSRIKEREIDAEFKREMLDRGMTADDIQKVIEAVPPQSGVDRWLATWCKKK